jgi:hypothetical protein
MGSGENMNIEVLAEEYAELLHYQWVEWSFSTKNYLKNCIEACGEVDEIYEMEKLQDELHRWSLFFIPYDTLPEDRKMYYKILAVKFVNKLLDRVNADNQINQIEEINQVNQIKEIVEDGRNKEEG